MSGMDLTAYICRLDTPLMDVLQRLTGLLAGRQFQVVLDGEGRVVGSITDGDIRRGLIRGATLNMTAAEVMNRAVRCGRRHDPENQVILTALRSDVRFVPIIDEERRLLDVLIAGVENDRAGVSALIMAGGYGRRLGELTKHTPKPLIEVAGRPILEHVLSNLEEADIRDIYISTHYLADKVVEFLNTRKSTASIHTVFEHEPLGTAGAIGLLPERVKRGSVLVSNADLISSVNLRAFLDYQRQHDWVGLVAVRQHDVKIDFGVVQQAPPGEFAGIVEKPSHKVMIAAGLYLLNGVVCDLVKAGEQIDMPDLLNKCYGEGHKLGVFPIHEEWIDVGRLEDLRRAQNIVNTL